MAGGTVASSSELEPRSSTLPAPIHGHGPEAARIIHAAYQSAGLKGLDLALDPTPEPVSIGTRSATAVIEPAPDAPAQPQAERPRVARNLGALAGGQLVTWTMTLVWTLIVPRALGPVGLGILVSAQSVAGVLGIVLGLGTRQYLVREIVLLPHEGSKLVGTALVLRLMLAPLVGIAAVLWAYFAHYSHEATVVLYLITAMTIFTLMAEPMQAGFQAIERMKYLALADVINKSAQSVIGIALVLVGLRTVGIAASMATIAGCVVVLNVVWLRRFLSIDVKTSGQRLASMTKESFTFWAFGLFAFIYFWIDTIMLSLMTPSHVVGWYGSTMQILQTLMFLPVLVSTAWLPRLVNAASVGHRQLVTLARTPVDGVLVISVPIAAGTALIARPLIHVVYGPAFAHAVPVLMLLACCIPPLYLNIMLAQVLLAEKRQAVWTIVMAAAAIVNPLFNLFLIPYTQRHYGNGAIGAAISLILTEVLMDAVGFMLVGRHVFTRSSIRRCALAILASAGMWGAAYAAAPLGSALSVLIGGVVLVALVIVLRILTPEEITVLRKGIGRLRRRRVQLEPEPQPSSG
jgi:O-antigen/teichoic acid export membrane protein